ncbi:hypothetical protein EMIT0P218_20269 [Pseudomonas sp. IT-P218]
MPAMATSQSPHLPRPYPIHSQPTHLPRLYPIHCRSWLASEGDLTTNPSPTAVPDPL